MTAPLDPGREQPTGRVAAVRSRVRHIQGQVEASRETIPAVDAAFEVRARDRLVAGNLLACAIAYRLFLWLLPVALVIAAILGFFEAAGRSDPEDLAKSAGLSAYVVSSVSSASSQASGGHWAILAIGLVALYSAGSAGAATIAAVHHLAWGEGIRRPRGLVPALAFNGTMIGVLVVTFGAQVIRHRAPGLGIGAALLVGIVYLFLWLGVSILLPHGDATWPHLLPGAIFGAVAMQVLHLVTVYYLVRQLEHSSELYGGLGSAAAVLLWLYLIGRVVLGAAVLNASLWERTKAREAAERDAASPSAGEAAPGSDEVHLVRESQKEGSR